MGLVLQFRVPERQPAEPESEPLQVDLMTAVDVAIRDLDDIIPYIFHTGIREQAEACRRMLQDSFDAALQAG
ncbi:hypothetical protein DWF00_01585 [Bosea caraganae]|uniref:Uncharacterized protein n=1 Tax=Bosea caraganae TaxID=2763117 RepID=A0A370L9E8_9HYPH|nr:hypothetical protein [Bosea caraganae]RDJ26897.1 hypothetical protein DWE98_08605 [Bosea caraganae]RDJ30784.1 hypothetical protein DWF00_01585 [Bosea caraganae]